MAPGGKHIVKYSTGLLLKGEVCASFELLRGKVADMLAHVDPNFNMTKIG